MPASGRPPLPRSSSAEYVPPSRSQSMQPPGKSSRGESHSRQDSQSSRHDDGDLYDPPANLVCPISHEVFSDPVVNTAGQVYERSSIEQHLTRHNTDPITGMRLTSKVLTPIYYLKSQATEYRESAARNCVERATDIGTRNAIRYVRRAAELCDALPSPVPGLAQECVDYIKAHPSNVYDMPALHLFARGLLNFGQRDRAAAVYFTLLQEGADKAQQAGLLRQCLACWNVGAEAGSQADTVRMLAGFVQQAHAPTAVQVVDIAQEANLDHGFITEFCELLLFRPGAPLEIGLTPREWNQQKQILLKYVQVSCSYIAHQQSLADTRMSEVSEQATQLRAMLASQPHAPAVVALQPQKSTSNGRGGRVVAGLCLAASFLAPRPDVLAVRIFKAASALALMHYAQ